jgi:hypothetical protein
MRRLREVHKRHEPWALLNSVNLGLWSNTADKRRGPRVQPSTMTTGRIGLSTPEIWRYVFIAALTTARVSRHSHEAPPLARCDKDGDH